MTTPVAVAAAAEADIIATAAWYDRQAPGLGDSFVGHVDAIVEKLRHHPEM